MDSKKTWNAIREMGVCNKNTVNNLSAINPNDLNEKFLKIPTSVINTDYYENYTSPFCISNMFNFVFVTEFDIVKHFHKIKSNAIGLDNIHPVFLKYMLPKLLPYICYMFNTILRTASYLLQWKTSKEAIVGRARL